MLSPSRCRTTPVLVAVCALALTACSILDDEDEIRLPDPSAISPDTFVNCEDNGDCGEEGAVRWSLPIAGDYYLERYEEEPPRMAPAGQWMDYSYPSPGAVKADGVLYLHTADEITALDTADGAPLWTESLGSDVNHLRVVGSTLVAGGPEYRDEGSDLHLLHVDREGMRPLELDQPEDVADWGFVASDDTHLVLRETLRFDSEEDPRYYQVDVGTGEVEWSARLESASSHTLAEGRLYLQYSPEDDPAYVIAVREGEETDEFEVPEEASERIDLLTVPDGGPLLFDTPSCAPGDGWCDGQRITAVDPDDDGEVLWSHPVPGGVVSLNAGPDDEHRVHVHDEDGYRTLDASTGEVLAEDEEVEPADLLSEFGAKRLPPRGELTEEEYDLLPFRPTGPGVEAEHLEGLAAGVDHVTTYEGPEGEIVGVYSGCAPDGLREPGLDEPTGDGPCAEPRLFAVDY